MYRIGICDDEKSTCGELEGLIQKYGIEHGLNLDVNVWYSGESLCNYLKTEEVPDLLFLDIELISTDGIKVGRYIREELENMEIMIVYISSKSSYAMNLFRIQPLDFLIKPIGWETVQDIMERSLHMYERKNQIFAYRIKGYHFSVPFRKIMYFYSQNKKVGIVMKDEEVQFYGKLKEIAGKVPHNFMMIHQSFLVNLDYVEECSYEMMKMLNGSLLSISQPYRRKVREQIMQYKWEKMK
ncbi:MAG: response regulator transcription factor [Lachnospiraceae bacterium]|jgi:DNA-binding LytR/AlgR family response regulator|nr:response regulator transcription factor [Lachnospiraceae bacterium]